ncbi:MAG: TetR family transcriptional regulator [Frondihabitans sp.]|nr:TetR family transcriptional regulator [Frondihabitans sp.]
MSPRSTGARGSYAKSAQRRSEIVAAAREVFAENGYRNGSIQSVADRAGLSQSAVLHHFDGKEGLLLAVLADRDARGDDLTGNLDLAEGMLAQARHNESTPGIIELYTTLCAEAASVTHPAHAYFAERFARLRVGFAAELSDLAHRGQLRPGVDPAQAAAGLVALWDGIQLQWLLAPDEIDVAEGLRHYLSLVLVDGVLGSPSDT